MWRKIPYSTKDKQERRKKKKSKEKKRETKKKKKKRRKEKKIQKKKKKKSYEGRLEGTGSTAKLAVIRERTTSTLLTTEAATRGTGSGGLLGPGVGLDLGINTQVVPRGRGGEWGEGGREGGVGGGWGTH